MFDAKLNDLIWHESTFSLPNNTKIAQSLPRALYDVLLQWPKAVAVISKEKIYNFRDLANRVAGLSDEINQFAHLPGPIALLQKSGVDAIAAWFACSLSNRSFLLLEPNHPRERLIEIMRASNCTLALVDDSTASVFAHSVEITQFISDGRFGTFQHDKGLQVEEPSMIFPTSGSTGKPKLITYTTTTIQVKVQCSIQLMSVPQQARVVIAGSHSNYGYLHHALVFLLSGSAIYLVDFKTSGFDALLNAISTYGVRHVRFTPSLFRKLAVLPKAKIALQLLDAVRFSGEPLLINDLKLANSVLHPNCLIQNIYGSTESTLFIWSNSPKNSNYTGSTAPIGKIYPLSSYSIQPLQDSSKNYLKGELLTRSKFHAIGDYEEGLINRERFPILKGTTDERIYATGDIVQQLPDGNLLHLGRLGRMVKVRGNRVFLSEIEQQLRSIDGVTDAAVVDVVEQDNIVLYGFITTEPTNFTATNLRNELALQLPDFMIPRSIDILESIPLLAGGKTDYQALLKLIASPSKKLSREESQDDYTHLIQVWDSLLFAGAHKYPSDFFSLGGDSLGFMLLIVEIEAAFGVSFQVEEFRSNCTLHYLAIILGIYWPDSQEAIIYKSLQARLFSTSLGDSKGIALAMPGYGGLSHAYPFHKAGFFQDHDIWVVEFPIKAGTMLQKDKWYLATLEIVQAIKEGIIPTPRIIFGFSFAGGLAWLVSRLLAGLQMSPDFVVLVDARPLHKRLKFRHRKLKKELKNVKSPISCKIIHLTKSTLGKHEALRKKEILWDKNDTVQKLIKLPTTYHLDMINWEILALAKNSVTAFLNDQDFNFNLKPTFLIPNLWGCLIFHALDGNKIAIKRVMEELANVLENLTFEQLIDTAILMIALNEKIKLRQILIIALQRFPYSVKMNYLNKRINRNPNLLFYGDIFKIFPTIVRSIENAITPWEKLQTNLQPLAIRHLFLTIDLLSASFVPKYYHCIDLLVINVKSKIISLKRSSEE